MSDDNLKQEDIEFFAKNGMLAIRPDETTEAAQQRRGREMATAEAESAARGWYVHWKVDHDANTTPDDHYFVSGNPQWEAVLYDEDGEVRASLVGIDFAEDYTKAGRDVESDPYARVVAAELAEQALYEEAKEKEAEAKAEASRTEAENVIIATAAARGWSPEDSIRLLCEFIEEQELTGDLFSFLGSKGPEA